MSVSFDDITWHRAVGQLIDALDKPNFWAQLVRLLDQYVAFDSWVVLLFSADQHPQVFAECPGADGSPDPLFQDYLRGLYLLDPFYGACVEQVASGCYGLFEVAPDHFEVSEYYQSFYRHSLLEDELNYILQVAPGQSLAVSLAFTDKLDPFWV